MSIFQYKKFQSGGIKLEELLIVLNKDEDTVSIVDIEKRKEIRKIAVSRNPHGVELTPDGMAYLKK